MTQRRVIIADDDRDSADTLAELLELTSTVPLAVLVAYGGREALGLALQLPAPEVVILDIEMPGMSGAEVAEAVRSARPSNPPLLIAVSGDIGVLHRAHRAGLFDHELAKPVDVRALLALVE